MIDKVFIREKIDLIERDLKRLEEFRAFTIADLAQDYIKYAAFKNFLMEIIGRVIDINQHVILEASDLKEKTPLDYTESFRALGNMNVWPEEFANEIAKSAGFRDAIVHGYNDLDKNIVYRSVQDALDQYAKYCDYVLKWVESK